MQHSHDHPERRAPHALRSLFAVTAVVVSLVVTVVATAPPAAPPTVAPIQAGSGVDVAGTVLQGRAAIDVARRTEARRSVARKRRTLVRRRVCTGSGSARRCRVVRTFVTRRVPPAPIPTLPPPPPPVLNPDYPAKPEAPAPPRPGGFSPAATEAARTVLAGTGIYFCNEIVGIDGPTCAGGFDQSDEELIAITRDVIGARQLWVRCGDSRRGFPKAHRDALARLRPKANAAGLMIVCWDVPNFWDVREDARRLAEMAPFADAVASDLESGNDTISANGFARGGGYAGPELLGPKGERWAAAYSGWVRHDLATVLGGAERGDAYPLVAVTMQPQTHGSYPFAALATGFPAFSPMLYRGLSWFEGGDMARPESVRPGNPFIATAFAAMRARGVTADRHVLHVTGMTYRAPPGLTAHENQIARDMAETKRSGGVGFSGFVYRAVVDTPPWAEAMRTFVW